jgi:hypothetical protein
MAFAAVTRRLSSDSGRALGLFGIFCTVSLTSF